MSKDDLTPEEEAELEQLDEEIEEAKERLEAESHAHDETFIGHPEEGEGNPPA